MRGTSVDNWPPVLREGGGLVGAGLVSFAIMFAFCVT
jgi:hypothetical protein